MVQVTDLPPEVVALTLQNLDDIKDLVPSLLACRHFYSSFRESTGTKAAIRQRQIHAGLLPYAVSVAEASQLQPRTIASVRSVLDTLYNPSTQLAPRLRSLTSDLLRKMAHTDHVISGFTLDFAKSAGLRLPPDVRASAPESPVLSPTESFRFRRAFYRLELFYNLLRDDVERVRLPLKETHPLFFSRHPPWENEQIGCVHHFLEEEFVRAAREVVAHDVAFGEHSIDYLTLGDNYCNQLWLSQGVSFVSRLVRTTSYEAKKGLLESTFCKGHLSFHDASLSRSDDDDDPLVENLTEEELRSLVPYDDGWDPDKGPCKAWVAGYAGFPRSASLMMDDAIWLRERAYVLWDWHRIDKHGLLGVITGTPEKHCFEFSFEELSAMEESFEERSQIWRRGGRGYWVKGDTSQIEWPGGHE